MATQVHAHQLFRYSFHINKSQPLGHGSYGAVYKAKCDQLTCAAKVLHPTILDPIDPEAGKIMQRFEQECAFLESIRHPNIVQYLGVTRDPESGLPVLLMELLDESLTKMLEHSPTALPYFVEVDICHDIALAVAYLHSNDIIHRDLSSNNVLIVAKRRAKVTDFGMSMISCTAKSMTYLTRCPGTFAYMSPEALADLPAYTNKLDCFSEGVLMIQVCTRLWPKPGPRTKTIPFPASPTGTIEMPVLERERRQNHIDKIDHNHSLLPIAMDCLRYQENERPSSEKVCERLAVLKEAREYRESMERVEREQSDVAELERQIREIQLREMATLQQLRDKNPQLLCKIQSQLRTAELERENHQRQDQSLVKEQEQDQENHETKHSLPRPVEQLQQHTSQQYQPARSSAAVELAEVGGKKHQQDHPVKLKRSQPRKRKMMLGKWEDGGKAPIAMFRGAAVVHENVAYFMHCYGETYSYNKRWSKLLMCPYRNSGLAVIKGFLTAVGGRSGIGNGRPQNKLLSIVHKKWVEHFPPMPTKRSSTAIVNTQEHLIVAGGWDNGSNYLNAVEVMDIQAQVWSTAASLPHPYKGASATICRNHLYMLGGYDKHGHSTKSVLTCSLTNLLQSLGDQETSHSVWNSVSDAPVYGSTCVAVNGELLAVGGLDEKCKKTSAVYKYEPASDSWGLISNMLTARYHCLVAVLPTNEMLVVGGEIGILTYTNEVDIVHINLA